MRRTWANRPAREGEEAGLQPPVPGAWTQGRITTPGLAKEHFERPVARRTWLGDHPVHGGETHGPPGKRGRAFWEALPPRLRPSLAVSHLASGSQGGSWKRSRLWELPADVMRRVSVCTACVADSPWIKALKFKCISAWLQ